MLLTFRVSVSLNVVVYRLRGEAASGLKERKYLQIFGKLSRAPSQPLNKTPGTPALEMMLKRTCSSESGGCKPSS